MSADKSRARPAKVIRVRMDVLESIRDLCNHAGFKVLEGTIGTLTSTRLSGDAMNDLGVEQPLKPRPLSDAELVDMALRSYVGRLGRFLEAQVDPAG